MRRGEIFWADLAPRSGSEQSGRRPVIVVSHDGFNQTPNWHSVIVVPVSSSETQSKRGPTATLLPAGIAGLKKASVALCHQVTTIDRAKLSQSLGMLTDECLEEIEAGLKAAMDLK